MKKEISMTKRQFQLLGIDHVVLRVLKLQPMLEFYQDVLGCKLIRSNEKIGLYQLSAGASMIDLIPVDMELGKEDYRNLSIPKMVFTKSNRLLYSSRAAIPSNKKNEFKMVKKTNKSFYREA